MYTHFEKIGELYRQKLETLYSHKANNAPDYQSEHFKTSTAIIGPSWSELDANRSARTIGHARKTERPLCPLLQLWKVSITMESATMNHSFTQCRPAREDLPRDGHSMMVTFVTQRQFFYARINGFAMRSESGTWDMSSGERWKDWTKTAKFVEQKNRQSLIHKLAKVYGLEVRHVGLRSR